MFEGIGLPAFFQMLHGMTADSAVDELEAALWMSRTESCSNEKRVAVAELEGGIDLLWLAEGIGDRVTLE